MHICCRRLTCSGTFAPYVVSPAQCVRQAPLLQVTCVHLMLCGASIFAQSATRWVTALTARRLHHALHLLSRLQAACFMTRIECGHVSR